MGKVGCAGARKRGPGLGDDQSRETAEGLLFSADPMQTHRVASVKMKPGRQCDLWAWFPCWWRTKAGALLSWIFLPRASCFRLRHFHCWINTSEQNGIIRTPCSPLGRGSGVGLFKQNILHPYHSPNHCTPTAYAKSSPCRGFGVRVRRQPTRSQEATPRDVTLADSPWVRDCHAEWQVQWWCGPLLAGHPLPITEAIKADCSQLAWSWGVGPQASNQAWPLPHCVTFGKLHDLSEPLRPH